MFLLCSTVRNLSTELQLYLVLQRGSLRYLLEWIETALMCPRDVTMSSSSFIHILSQIDEAINCDSKKLLSLDVDTLNDSILVNEVAVLLMKVVRFVYMRYL